MNNILRAKLAKPAPTSREYRTITLPRWPFVLALVVAVIAWAVAV